MPLVACWCIPWLSTEAVEPREAVILVVAKAKTTEIRSVITERKFILTSRNSSWWSKRWSSYVQVWMHSCGLLTNLSCNCILTVLCMLHVACCMLHVACCMSHVACCMLHVACCMLHVAINDQLLHYLYCVYGLKFWTKRKLEKIKKQIRFLFEYDSRSVKLSSPDFSLFLVSIQIEG